MECAADCAGHGGLYYCNDLELVPAKAAPASGYRVHCGQFVVEFDEGFNDDVLARLLAVVAGC